MSCEKFEPDLALYAGGDLPPGRIQCLQAHLTQCGACRCALEELREGRTLLTGLNDDFRMLHVDELTAQVHSRVMAEVRQSASNRRGALAPLLLLAAALLATIILAWPKHKTANRVAVTPVVAPAIAPAPKPAVIRVQHRRARHRHIAPKSQPGPPTLVQLVTNDPNIVIYWLVDPKQGD